MKYLKIFWSLARYRVAVMLGMFMLIAFAYQGSLSRPAWVYIVSMVALLCTYVSATGFNDLADEEIDRTNHAGKKGRLLVTGEATRRELATVAIGASALMLLSGLLISPAALAVMLLSLTVNITYSLPPLRLSYRTFLVPLVLAIGYVVAPFLLGLVLARATIDRGNVLLLAALYALFIARINLKDFRDRKGDSKYGKPTLLLRYGKNTTVLVSQVALWIGAGLAAVAVTPFIMAWWLVFVYGAIISLLLMRLRAVNEGPAEQVIIGVAAKVGNGLLLSLLAVFFLYDSKANQVITLIVLALLLAGSVANLKFLTQDPKLILESYRG